MSENGRTEVFYDGDCPLCGASRRWAERRDRKERLAFCALADPAAARSLPVRPERIADAMWVRLPSGELVSGFAGWLAVLGVLPRWRVLARVAGMPPLRWLGPAVYRLVARHRHAVVRR